MNLGGAWLKIARRELAGGLGGFWIYLACLALGAWAIAAAGSTTASYSRGLERQARLLLGGDAAVTLSQREATPAELAWLEERAVAFNEAANMDIMARHGDVVRQVDVRGIDDDFPLLGAFAFNAGAPELADILARRNGVWGIAASRSLLDDLGLSIGDRLVLGGFDVEVRAELLREPDRIGEPGIFEPRALIAIEALRERGQLAPGRLFRVSYRLLLKPQHASAFEADLLAAWRDAGLRYSGPEDAVEGLRMLFDMLNSFMTVIGVSALLVGGVGVAQASSAFLETRMDSIATLKALGAGSGTIQAAYAAQLGALACLGAAAGVALGALSPWILEWAANDAMPLPAEMSLYPRPLLKAFLLAVLAAVMFTATPLGRARMTSPAVLFRRVGGEAPGKSPAIERWIAVAAAAALAVIAIADSSDPLLVLGLIAGAGLAYLVLFGAAGLLKRIARRQSRHVRGYLRLALASLAGPNSLAPVMGPALGLGLALMTLISVAQANLLGQLRETAPANAPSILFRQIPHEDAAEFDALMQSHGVNTDDTRAYRRAPFILGRVISLKGEALDESRVSRDERWVVRGETAMTVLAARPPEAVIRSGEWWPEDYSGPLLVSVEEGAARGLGLGVGDDIGFRIFGREVGARVSSIRKVDWAGFGANMAFILSPGTLEAARPFHTAIVILPPEQEAGLIRAASERWPDALAFQLRRTLETAADLFAEVALAVTALSSVVTTAGVLVLFGAFGAAARKRRRESALLKVFGGSRAAILGLYALEFALAAAAAVIPGAVLGVAAAHPIVILVFEAAWRFDWIPVLAVGFMAAIGAAAGGAAVGWSTLSDPPARVLRSA